MYECLVFIFDAHILVPFTEYDSDVIIHNH